MNPKIVFARPPKVQENSFFGSEKSFKCACNKIAGNKDVWLEEGNTPEIKVSENGMSFRFNYGSYTFYLFRFNDGQFCVRAEVFNKTYHDNLTRGFNLVKITKWLEDRRDEERKY